jgi:hypothetical protein
MLPDQLLDQIAELSEAHAKAHICRSFAEASDDGDERAHLNARAEHWDTQVAARSDRLMIALNTAISPVVCPALDSIGCVHMSNDDAIELRGETDHAGRAVTIRMTPAQAVAIGTALIACAGASATQTGGYLADVLPPIPPPSHEPIDRAS